MNWKQYKFFNQLFAEGETSIELLNCSFAKRAKDMGYIVENKNAINKTELYDDFYKKEISEKFNLYNQLIKNYEFVYTNFDEKQLSLSLK